MPFLDNRFVTSHRTLRRHLAILDYAHGLRESLRQISGLLDWREQIVRFNGSTKLGEHAIPDGSYCSSARAVVLSARPEVRELLRLIFRPAASPAFTPAAAVITVIAPA